MSAGGDIIQTERKTLLLAAASGHLKFGSCSHVQSLRLPQREHMKNCMRGRANQTLLRLKTLETCLSLAGALTTQSKPSITPRLSG